MKTLVQTLCDYRYTGRDADSSDKEPEKLTKKKIGDLGPSEDEDFPTSTKKRKRLIEISKDSN